MYTIEKNKQGNHVLSIEIRPLASDGMYWKGGGEAIIEQLYDHIRVRDLIINLRRKDGKLLAELEMATLPTPNDVDNIYEIVQKQFTLMMDELIHFKKLQDTLAKTKNNGQVEPD